MSMARISRLPIRPRSRPRTRNAARTSSARRERAFVRYGFHAATMQNVADEAGMSAGNLYRYFPSKEAIVEGLASPIRLSAPRFFAA